MNTSNSYLDAVKTKLGLVSDYQLAKFLGCGHARISNYRSGYSKFDDEMAVKAASILEIDPMIVIAAVNAERAKNEETKAIWKALFERLGGVAATLLIASGLNIATPSNSIAGAASSVDVTSNNNVYYVKSTRRNRYKKQSRIDLSFLVQNLLKFA